MSVNIIKKQDFAKGILAKDMKDGSAYIDADGNLYIGNSVKGEGDTIKAFSLCGTTIAWETDEESRYVEIDLDIIVK